MRGKEGICFYKGGIGLCSEPRPTAILLYQYPWYHAPTRERNLSQSSLIFISFLVYFLRLFRRLLLLLSLSSTLSLFLCVKSNWPALVCSVCQLICYVLCGAQDLSYHEQRGYIHMSYTFTVI